MDPRDISVSDKELGLQKAVNSLMSELPAPVRRFIASPERTHITQELSQKYGLHVDQAGEFERAFIYMLLGVITPEELVRALRAAGITEEQISGLIEDINKEVFMRLRDEERAETKASSIPSQSAITRPSIPVYSPLPTPAVVEQPKPKVVLPPPNLPGQLPETPAPRPVPPPAPRIEVPVPPKPVEVRQPEAPKADANARVIHTMARDMEALKGGADPFRVAHPAPPAWAEVKNTPIPPPAPVTPQPVSVAPVVAPPTPEPKPTPHPQEPLRAHLKQYGVDPYREPVE